MGGIVSSIGNAIGGAVQSVGNAVTSIAKSPIVKIAAPIVAAATLGPAAAAYFGTGAVAGGAIAGAAAGGLNTAIGGGSVLQGAVKGGLSGAATGYFMPGPNGTMIDPVTGLSEAGQGVTYGGGGAAWGGNAAVGATGVGSMASTAGKTVGFMDYLNAGLGVTAALQGGNKIDPNAAQNAADPFAPYRPAFAGHLANLMANPNSVTQTPGFQFLQQQGDQAVQRTLAAHGKIASGNEMLAMQQQGQGLAQQQYDDQFNKLSVLSGAAQSPVAGGQQWGNAASANIIQDQNKTNNLLQLAQNPAIQQGVNKLGSWAAGGFV